MNTPTKDKSLNKASDRKEYFYQEMRKRIMNLELEPDEVLDEMSLSAEFGMSRSPIREAIQKLATEGYIELEANRPARVSAMNYQSVREFYLASPMLYTITTQLAVNNASNYELEQLKAIQCDFCTAIRDKNTNERSLHNIRFHYAIGEMAHNEYLMPSLKRVLIDHARIGKIFYKRPAQIECFQSWNEAVTHHEQIISAIETRDDSHVKQIIKEHMNLSHQCLIDYVSPKNLDVPFL